MTIQEQAALMKLDSPKMAATTIEDRNAALKAVITALLSNKEAILAANKKDLSCRRYRREETHSPSTAEDA